MPLTDEEWVEVASELPSFDDDILKTYLAKRTALKAEEQKERSGLLLFFPSLHCCCVSSNPEC